MVDVAADDDDELGAVRRLRAELAESEQARKRAERRAVAAESERDSALRDLAEAETEHGEAIEAARAEVRAELQQELASVANHREILQDWAQELAERQAEREQPTVKQLVGMGGVFLSFAVLVWRLAAIDWNAVGRSLAAVVVYTLSALAMAAVVVWLLWLSVSRLRDELRPRRRSKDRW